MTKRKKILEAPQGTYTPLPHNLVDSASFMGASHPARSLLCELLRQHNSRNNGHLQLTSTWLKKRGWTSNAVVHRAKLELIKRGLIIQTRQGGLNAGANLYALTWLPISNFVGLDIQSKDYHQGQWRFMDSSPVIGKHKLCSASRCGTAPPNGMAGSLAAPSHGTKTALFVDSTAPPNGNNEYIPIPTDKTFKPVVGRKGKSGIPKTHTAHKLNIKYQ